MKEAIILIPGIMGSELWDGDIKVWPGDASELLMPYRHMTSLSKPNLVARDVIRSVLILNQYGDLIKGLQSCGFREDGTPANLVVLPYDWRKDNAESARVVAQSVDELAGSLGEGGAIHLLAHSMGGLVSRHYLESGLFNKRSGFSKVRSLITIATPHRGAPAALRAAMGLEKKLFLSAEQVRELSSNPLFPSLYQLLPPRGEPFAWDRDEDARLEPRDIYDHQLATDLCLVKENLAAAERFHKSLNLSHKPPGIRYFTFVGNRETTSTSVKLSPKSTRLTDRARTDDRKQGGDGTVPIWSASLPGIQMEPVRGEHGAIYKGSELRKVLAALLGKPGLMAAAGLVPELWVRDQVVEAGATTHVTLELPRGSTKISGELSIRRSMDASGTPVSNKLAKSSYTVSYSGPVIDHLVVVVPSPDFAGAYVIEFTPEGTTSAIASTEVLVQEPPKP